MTDLVYIEDDLLAEATPAERALYARYLAQQRGADPFAVLGYSPTPKQRAFHDAIEWDVLFGGAAGGGKTRALLMHGIRECHRHPGLVAAAFRRTYQELDESLIAELAKVGYGRDLGASWNIAKRDLTFANGSVMRFRYAENLQDATLRQGSEIQLLLIDERGLVAPDVVDFLLTRVRSGDSRLPVLGIRSTTNPGGPGHGYLKSRYVEATQHGETTYLDGRGRSVRFIPARLSDNPHVNVEYAADLQGISDPQLRRALLDGDWDVFKGMVFTEWSYSRHVVDPWLLPEGWQRYAAVDYGYTAPWAVVWAAADEDGRLWVYREIYATGVGERDQARRILEAEADGRSAGMSESGTLVETPEPLPYRVGDPAMWASRGDAEAISTAYLASGCAIQPANNNRLAGWARLHHFLADGPACAHHRAQGWEACPRLHVFSTCHNLIRTLPALPYSQTRPEDADTKAEDHIPDALRYLCLSVGQKPSVYIPEETPTHIGDEKLLVPFGGFAVDPDDLQWGSQSDPW